MMEKQSTIEANSRCELFTLSKQQQSYLLKIFLLWHSHQLLCKCHKNKFLTDHHSTSITELYMIDSKLVQVIIEDILETGEYTLEGIAHYARMPLDLFVDIMCGKNISPSITLWSKVISLYIQVKPELARYLFETITSEKDVKNNLVLQPYLGCTSL